MIYGDYDLFTSKDYLAIDRTYFFVFQETSYCIIVKSKNTSHFWKLIPSAKSKIEIYHSHQGNGNYHKHDIADSLSSSYSKIKAHDHYQLTMRRKEFNDYDYIPLLSNEDYFIF